MLKGLRLLTAVASESARICYKLDGEVASKIFGETAVIPQQKMRQIIDALDFPVRVDGEETPFHKCLIYVAGYFAGKGVDELAQMLGEDPAKARAMFRQGVVWASKIAYATVRLAYLSADESVRDAGVELLSNCVWTAIKIYLTVKPSVSVYGLYRNVSREAFLVPRLEDAEELEKEMAWLLDGSNLERVVEGEATPIYEAMPEASRLDKNKIARKRPRQKNVGGESLDELESLLTSLRKASYRVSAIGRGLRELSSSRG
jgi:hypothetical protein